MQKRNRVKLFSKRANPQRMGNNLRKKPIIQSNSYNLATSKALQKLRMRSVLSHARRNNRISSNYDNSYNTHFTGRPAVSSTISQVSSDSTIKNQEHKQNGESEKHAQKKRDIQKVVTVISHSNTEVTKKPRNVVVKPTIVSQQTRVQQPPRGILQQLNNNNFVSKMKDQPQIAENVKKIEKIDKFSQAISRLTSKSQDLSSIDISTKAGQQKVKNNIFMEKLEKFVNQESQKKQKILNDENLEYKKILNIQKAKDGKPKIKVSVKIELDTQKQNKIQQKSELTFKDINVKKIWEKIENIQEKSPQIAQILCDDVMNEPITLAQQKTSQNIRNLMKEKAQVNPDSIENVVNKVAEELQKCGIPVIMSENSTVKSQISLKTLTEGFMQNTVKVEETIPDNDPSCPFVYQELEEPQEFQKFGTWYKLKIAKQTGLDPNRIVIHGVAKGSIKVEWSTDQSDKLNESFDTHPEFQKRLKLKPFFQSFHLSHEDFDIRGNIHFNETKSDVQTRGGWPYYQPIKCKRYGINVSKKYDNGNDTWLDMKGNKGQWAVAFHGVSAPGQFCPGNNKKVLNSIMDGRQTNSMLMTGYRNAWANDKPLNRPPNEQVGNGIYCSPHIKVAFNGYTNSSDKYALVLQCRVNPKEIKVCSNHKFWVINDTKNIRPYGIILIKNQTRRQYPSESDQFGKEFRYADYKNSIEAYIKSY